MCITNSKMVFLISLRIPNQVKTLKKLMPLVIVSIPNYNTTFILKVSLNIYIQATFKAIHKSGIHITRFHTRSSTWVCMLQ